MDKMGFGFPVRFRVEVSNDPAFAQPIVVSDHSQTDFPNPGSQALNIAARRIPARFVRVTATRLWKKKMDEFLFALAEIKISSGKANLAHGAVVTASDSVEKERWGRDFIADGYDSLTHLDEPTHPKGYKSVPANKPGAAKWVQLDLGKKVPVDGVRLFPASMNVNGINHPFGFPVRFRVEVSNDPDFTAGSTVIYQTRTNFTSRDLRPVEITSPALPARYVRITATRLSDEHHEYNFALAEVQVLSEGQNVAQAARIRALDSVESADWGAQFLADGFDRSGPLGNTADVLNMFDLQNQWHRAMLKRTEDRNAQLGLLLDDREKQERMVIAGNLEELDSQLAALPDQKLVYAAANDFPEDGTFTAASEPRPVHLLERGDVTRPKELIKPGALSCVPNLTNEFQLTDSSREGDRRAALARWITDPRNAVTWRSIVNRVWSYHFGRGIVDSPNDFGNMGSAPTHPELLDWLAGEFLAHGQSLKWLHKQIVTSAAYRQASAYREDYARIDSGNQFLWRMNRERIDAESLRDSILSVSSKLDLTMGGPGYDLFEFKDDFSPHYYYDKYQVDDPKTMRRSIYRFIVRSVPDPFMETLDCPDPSQSAPVRNTTITALQALSLLNNPFAVRMAELFATRLQQFSSDPARQIDLAFHLAFGRKPSAPELAEFENHAAKFGLPNTCRLIFNSNEFMFVD